MVGGAKSMPPVANLQTSLPSAAFMQRTVPSCDANQTLPAAATGAVAMKSGLRRGPAAGECTSFSGFAPTGFHCQRTLSPSPTLAVLAALRCASRR